MRRELRHLGSTLKLLSHVNRSAFVIGTTASVLESVAYPLVLLVVWRGMNLVLAGTAAQNLVSRGLVLLGVLFGLLALETVLRLVTDAATTLLQAESAQQVNGRIMRKMAEVPYHLFEDNDFQARYGLLIAQASHQPGQLVQAFIGSLSALIASLAIAGTLFAFAPILVLFLLVLFPLTAMESRYHRRMVELQTTESPALFRMMYLAQRSIDATWQRDIRVHHSTILDDEYRFLASRYLGDLRALLRRYQFIRTAVGIAAAAVMTLAVGAVFLIAGRSPTGPAEAAVLLPALVMGLGQGRSFATSWGAVTECLGYLSKLFDFLNHSFEEPESERRLTSGRTVEPAVPREESEGMDGAPGVPVAPSSDPSLDATALLLRNVRYRYPHSQKVALDDLSYTFRTGTTAIVGPNGAGKSTLVKLATGLLAPTAGAIQARLADGAHVPAEQVPKAVLFQEPSHLYLTVRQNVTMRYERAHDEDARINQVLELAGLETVVAALPEGLDTLIGAGFGGHVDLSGGQWQRLALARLIYQDAPIMILDEPVASLDPEGERAVFELFATMQHRVIIFTTHRYDSIPPETPIVVLVDGRISEAGTHEDLLRRERDYWALYMSGRSTARPAGRTRPGRKSRSGNHEPSADARISQARDHDRRPNGAGRSRDVEGL